MPAPIMAPEIAHASDLALALGPRPWIVGHRGVAGEALENTLDGLRLALEQGVDMIEVDVRLTADRQLVLFHDADLERLGGLSWSVESEPAERLRSVRLRLRTATRRLEGTIPTLAEALETVPAGRPLNLELKRDTADPDAFAEALGGALGGRRRILVSSFDWGLLGTVRGRLPELPLAPLAKRGRRRLLAAGERLGAFSLHCHRRVAKRRFVERAATAGRPVLVYTVNRPGAARRLLRRGVAGLFSDHPGRLRAELAAP